LCKYFACTAGETIKTKMKNIIVAAWTALLMMVSGCMPVDRYVTLQGFAQGGTYTVKLNLNGRDGRIKVSPSEIKDSIDRLLSAIDNSLSGYNKKSVLSRFNEAETVIPDTLFVDMYEKAYEFYELTEGVVDASSAPLFDIWGFGFKSGDMPDEDEVRQAMSASGMGRLHRDMRSLISNGGTLDSESLLEDVGGLLPRLNYNALAQGYSCDLVARYLYGIGVTDMMVDIGEIFCAGKNPSGKAWTIGIDRPVDGNDMPGYQLQGVFKVPDGPHGVVTSGNYRKFYVRGGKKYAHTIDPRTGYPVGHNLLSATIVAGDALTADAYATYCMVIGLEASKCFIEETPGLEGCLVYDDSGTFRTWTSDGFVLE